MASLNLLIFFFCFLVFKICFDGLFCYFVFFRSPVTGKVGASKPLLEELEKAGIETRIIELPGQ